MANVDEAITVSGRSFAVRSTLNIFQLSAPRLSGRAHRLMTDSNAPGRSSYVAPAQQPRALHPSHIKGSPFWSRSQASLRITTVTRMLSNCCFRASFATSYGRQRRPQQGKTPV